MEDDARREDRGKTEEVHGQGKRSHLPPPRGADEKDDIVDKALEEDVNHIAEKRDLRRAKAPEEAEGVSDEGCEMQRNSAKKAREEAEGAILDDLSHAPL